MRKSLNVAVVLLGLALFLAGCAAVGYKPQSLTPKQKVIYFESVYLSAAKNVDAALKDPRATEAQKKAALQDKAILTQAYPLIKAYRSTVDGGGFPAPGDEKLIFDLLDRLINTL